MLTSESRVHQGDHKEIWGTKRNRWTRSISCNFRSISHEGSLKTLGVNFTSIKASTLTCSQLGAQRRIRRPIENIETYACNCPVQLTMTTMNLGGTEFFRNHPTKTVFLGKLNQFTDPNNSGNWNGPQSKAHHSSDVIRREIVIKLFGNISHKICSTYSLFF